MTAQPDEPASTLDDPAKPGSHPVVGCDGLDVTANGRVARTALAATHVATRLPARPESAAAGRRFIAQALDRWDLAALNDTASLLGNELVTNALLHARSVVELELTRTATALRVAVSDTGAAVPVRRHSGPEAISGRGLAMIEALATEWGVTLRPPLGKTVWFELPLPNGLPSPGDLPPPGACTQPTAYP